MRDSRSPIILLAHERSGTNLLRRIIGQHEAIAAPPPIHLLTWLAPFESFYGDLKNDNSFKRLVADAVQVSRLSFDPWPAIATPAQACEEIAPSERSLMSLFFWLHRRYAEQGGARRWFCKDKQLIDFAYEIALRCLDAQFIFLHRDPRGVFASYKAAPGGFKHAYPCADQWSSMQQACLRFVESDLLSTRAFRISYEEILADPNGSIARLCKFLGEEFTDAMLSTEAPDLRFDNSYWQNLGNEILRDNAKKYRSKLSSREIQLIEERAYALMQRLGYAPEIAASPRPLPVLKRGIYAVVNSARKHWHARTASLGEHEAEVTRRRRRFRMELEQRPWDKVEAFSANPMPQSVKAEENGGGNAFEGQIR